jgi:hypothetical protein
MGMGLRLVTSPDTLDPPPPGARSCAMTSLDPDDADEVKEPGPSSDALGLRVGIQGLSVIAAVSLVLEYWL